MSPKDTASKVATLFDRATGFAAWAAYVPLAFIVLVVFVDVCARYLFNKPLTGSYEMVVLSMNILGGFGIMYTTTKLGHIAVDIVIVRLPTSTQDIMQRLFSFMGFVVWAALAYWAFQQGLRSTRDIITVLFPVPWGPFRMALAIGAFLASLVSLLQVFYRPEPDEIVKNKEALV